MTESEQQATALRLLDAGVPAALCVTRTTSRWGTAIIAALLLGPHRFAALRDRVDGISEKMLAQYLRMLTRNGLVAREVAPTVPPQVTYSLTELGSSLAGPLTGLITWFEQHGDDLAGSRAAHDAAARRGPA